MIEEKEIKTDMMYCSECGTRIKRPAKFCEECGSRIRNSQPDISMLNSNFAKKINIDKTDVNLIKIILVSICTVILAFMWACAPVVKIDYVGGTSNILDYFSSSEHNEKLSIGQLFDMAGNMINYKYELPEELQTALRIILLILLVIMVFAIFALTFIFSLIKLDIEGVKKKGPRVTLCTLIIFLLLFCLVVTFNDFVENDIITIMQFQLDVWSYFIIALTIIMQCIVSNLIVKRKESIIDVNESQIRTFSWICPSCGTENQGGLICNKCGFENIVISNDVDLVKIGENI